MTNNRYRIPVFLLPPLLFFCASASAASVPVNPADAGGALPFGGSGYAVMDGVMGNPALVGLDGPPKGGLLLFPVSVALWSDKFAPPFNKRLLMLPFNTPRSAANYMAAFMRESFGLSGGLSPGEVSERLTEELRGGAGVHAGVRASPFAFATRGFGLSVSTFSEVDVRLSGGFLLPFFSEAEGLLAGAPLDLSDTRVNAIWATEVAVKLGYSAVIPFLRDYLKLDKGAAGVGLKALLGHAYLGASMRDGSALSYDEGENKYKADAVIDVVSAGTGLRGNFRYDKGYLFSNPINGQGWGLDLGAVFLNDRHAFSVGARDIGMILWSGGEVRRGSLIMKRDFDLGDLKLGMDSLFSIGVDTLAPDNRNYAMWLPAEVNAGYAYTMRFDGGLGVYLGYLSAGVGYGYRLSSGYGGGFSVQPSRFSGGASFGLLSGYLPVRYGLVYGGAEGLASVVGVGLDAKYVSLDAYYKAVGSVAMRSKKGFEAAAGLTVRWGWKRAVKYEKDGPGGAAPEEPGWILDSVSEPVLPELRGLLPDAEGDTVYEPVELPAAAASEPEPQMPEPVSEEPPQSEQLQPPEQLPSPPEPVPESELAPLPGPGQAPPPGADPWLPPSPSSEQLPLPAAAEAEALAAAQRAINFSPGSADLTEGSYAPLEEVANLLKSNPSIRYEVQGHTDSRGAEAHNLLLSAERAAVVKYYLMSRGAPDSCLVSIGYGKNMPVADNATTVGRALNRRVEFVPISTQEHYNTLKRFEMKMMKKLTERVLEKREWLKIIR